MDEQTNGNATGGDVQERAARLDDDGGPSADEVCGFTGAASEATEGREDRVIENPNPEDRVIENPNPEDRVIENPNPEASTGEPYFVLKANDVTAPDIVDAWALAADRSGSPRAKVIGAKNIAHQMRAWQRKNGSKVPD